MPRYDESVLMRQFLAMFSLAASLLYWSAATADQFDDAIAAFGRKEYASAFKIWKPLADQGMARAQYDLGLLYSNGFGVPKNYDEALKWYRLAADQGNAGGQNALGVMYADGMGVSPDPQEAVKWYRLAANQNLPLAQYNLGNMYAAGTGVTKDIAQAVNWYRKAADQDNALAQNNLAAHYAKGEGLPQDFGEAVKWYRKAADQGDATAQSNLGYAYLRGQGVKQDSAEALKWFRLATAQNNRDAQKAMGVMYATGQGVIQNNADAARLFRLAADQGQAEAQHNLGALYLKGQGVDQSTAEAVKWLTRAAGQGYEPSKTALAQLKGTPTTGASSSPLSATTPPSIKELLPEIADEDSFGPNGDQCRDPSNPTQAKEFLVWLTSAIDMMPGANRDIRANSERGGANLSEAQANIMRAGIDRQIQKNENMARQWVACRDVIAKSLSMTDADVRQLHGFNTLSPSYRQMLADIENQNTNGRSPDFSRLRAIPDRGEALHVIDLEIISLNYTIKKFREMVAHDRRSDTRDFDQKVLNRTIEFREKYLLLRQSIAAGQGTATATPQGRVSLQDCDRLAANSTDARRFPGSAGVQFKELRDNLDAALKACASAATAYPNELRFQYQFARALQIRDKKAAISFLLPLAQADYSAAFDNLGWLIIADTGDYEKAIVMFKRGYDLGDADCAVSLYEMIDKDKLYVPNPAAMRLELLEKAAAGSHASAMAALLVERAKQSMAQTTGQPPSAAPPSGRAASASNSYQSVSLETFLLDGKDLAARSAKVSMQGFYLPQGDAGLFFADQTALIMAAEYPEGANTPRLPLLTDDASRDFRQYLLACRSNPGSAQIGCPVSIVGHATMCVAYGPLGARRQSPCVSVEDGQPGSR